MGPIGPVVDPLLVSGSTFSVVFGVGLHVLVDPGIAETFGVIEFFGGIIGDIFDEIFGGSFGDILGDMEISCLGDFFAFGLIGGFMDVFCDKCAKTSLVSIGGVTDFATILSLSFQQDFERAFFIMS